MIITDMPHVTTKNQIVNALGYTPADQEDVLLKGEADGRNLVLDSASERTIEKNRTEYDMSEKFQLGVTYAITIWGEAESQSDFHMSLSNGAAITMIPKVSDGKYSAIAKRTDAFPSDLVNSRIRIAVNGENTGAGTIHRIKIEKGSIPTDWTPAPEDVVTKIPYDIFTALDPIPEMHRNLYRGRNLGESTQMSDEHKAAIQDGSFKDLFVGDYWTHDGINYRIADIDYFYNCGDTAFTKHHLVIVPDTSLLNAKMNDDNTTEGGYTGSKMYTEYMEPAKTKITGAFGDMVLTHKELLTNAVVDGRPSVGGWVESKIELMNEIMVYGSHIFTPGSTGTMTPYRYTVAKQQFALFALNPKMVNRRYTYWLRDVVTASAFARVGDNGLAHYGTASSSHGVRPEFIIGIAPTADEADGDMEVVGAVGSPERMEDDVE